MKTLLEIIITIVGYLLLSDCKIIVDYNKVYSKCIPSSNYAPYQESFDCSWWCSTNIIFVIISILTNCYNGYNTLQ